MWHPIFQNNFSVNVVWSQLYIFVVYLIVSALVTFIIFCKGDQQPPLPDSCIPILSVEQCLLLLKNHHSWIHISCLWVTHEVFVVHVLRQTHVSIHLPVHLSCCRCDLSSAQLALMSKCNDTRVHTKLTHLPPCPMGDSTHFAGFLACLSLPLNAALVKDSGQRKCLSKSIYFIFLDLVSPGASLTTTPPLP